MALSLVDLAWLAGVVEGEGSFFFETQKGRKSIRFSLDMTDEDVVLRCRDLLPTIGNINKFRLAHEAYKPICRWRVTRQEDVYGLMMMLFPFMGERRRAKIEELSRFFIGTPVRQRRKRTKACGLI